MILLKKDFAPLVISLFFLFTTIFPIPAQADYQALIGLNLNMTSGDITHQDIKHEIDLHSKSFYLRSYLSPISTNEYSNAVSINYAPFLQKASGFGLLYRQQKFNHDLILNGTGNVSINLINEEEDSVHFDAFYTFDNNLFLSLDLEQYEASNYHLQESVISARLDIGYYVLNNAKLTFGYGQVRHKYDPDWPLSGTGSNDTLYLSYRQIFQHQSQQPINLELNFEEEKNWRSKFSALAEYTLTSKIILGLRVTKVEQELDSLNFEGQFLHFNYYWSEKFALLSFFGRGSYLYNEFIPDVDAQQASLSIQHYF